MSDINQEMWDRMDFTEILAYQHDPDTTPAGKIEAQKQLDKRGYTPNENFIASIYTNSTLLAAFSLMEIANQKTTNLPGVVELLSNELRRLVDGGTRASELQLANNVITLNALYNNMMQRALLATDFEVRQAYMNIALRAQNQSRKTILALQQIKNPKQQTYVAQQNIAGVQQVNNGLRQGAAPESILKTENELISETTYEALDTGREAETIVANTRMATLEPVYRCENFNG